MRRRSTTRRELVATAAAAATIGCTERTGDGDDADSAALLSFGPEVDDDLRARVRTVYDRTVDLCGRELRAETTVELISVAEMQERAEATAPFGTELTQRLAHRALGVTDDLDADHAPAFTGSYDPARRTIALLERAPPGVDEAMAGVVDDQLLAHELGHAIQFQTTPADEWAGAGWAVGFDRRYAHLGLVEGTAMYLEDEYVDGCDGQFARCELGEPIPATAHRLDDEDTLAIGAYANGHDFAAALADRGEWAAIWDAHGDPPTHTGQVLKPAWYPDVDPEPVSVADPPDPRWAPLGTQRLGMKAAFATLWIAGVLPDDAVLDADEDDAVFSNLFRYRSSLTDAWRGDAFAASRRDHDLGWIWRLRWRDGDAAAAAAEAFREWLERRGVRTDIDGVWERDDRYERLARDGDAIVIAMAPSPDEFDALSPQFASA